MNQPTNTSKKYNNKEWSAMFEKLESYKREQNTCNVPKRWAADPKLGHWVHYQRTMRKAGKLSQERIDLLESIGFVWSERQSSNVSREQTSWDERFHELKTFQSIHGHCKVPRKGKDAALGRWVKWQRWNRTLLDRGESSVLTKRKIKLLNSIGFSWGYQRVPPQKKTIPVKSELSIEPLPYMPAEAMIPASTVPSSRNIITPPTDAPSFKNAVQSSKVSDNATFSSSRYGESNCFFKQEVHVPFNHHQPVNRHVTMSPLDDESVRFDRQGTPSPTFDFAPTQFQGYVMEPVPNNNMFGMNSSMNTSNMNVSNDFPRMNVSNMNALNDFPRMMDNQFKQEVKQMSMNRHVAPSRVWKCSVCRFASFETFDEALAHENNCNGFPEGSFCRACAA